MFVTVFVKRKEDIVKVALTWPNHGYEGDEDNSRRREEDVRRDQSGANRHLISTAQCPCYGQMYFPGSYTYRQTLL